MELLYSSLSHYFNDFPSDTFIQNLMMAKTLSNLCLPKELLEEKIKQCLLDPLWYSLPEKGVTRDFFNKLSYARSLPELQRNLFKLLLLNLFIRKHPIDSPLLPTYLEVCRYRHKETALYLATTLLTQGTGLSYQKKYTSLLRKYPSLKLPLIHLALWLGEEEPTNLSFLKTERGLQTLQALEVIPTLTSQEKLTLMTTLKEPEELDYVFILAKTSFFDTGYPLKLNLKEAVTTEVLQKLLKLDLSFAKNYWDLVHTERSPGSLAHFFATIHSMNEPLLQEGIRNLFFSLINHTFSLDRHRIDNHPHLQFLATNHPLVWEKWCQITDNWQDLLLSGTEVAGSCQHLNGLPYFNQCLLNTLQDGKIKLIALKNKEGKIVSRSLIKLLITDKGTPALFLEREYPLFASEGQKKLIQEKALFLAKHLQIPIYRLGKEEVPLFSLGSRSPEYEDGLILTNEGVTKGVYILKKTQIIDFVK